MESREDNNKSVLQCLYWWLLCYSDIYRLYQNKELKYVHYILGDHSGKTKGVSATGQRRWPTKRNFYLQYFTDSNFGTATTGH